MALSAGIAVTTCWQPSKATPCSFKKIWTHPTVASGPPRDSLSLQAEPNVQSAASIHTYRYIEIGIDHFQARFEAVKRERWLAPFCLHMAESTSGLHRVKTSLLSLSTPKQPRTVTPGCTLQALRNSKIAMEFCSSSRDGEFCSSSRDGNRDDHSRWARINRHVKWWQVIQAPERNGLNYQKATHFDLKIYWNK